MKTKIVGMFTLLVISLSSGLLNAADQNATELLTIPTETIVDKIRGGVLGQIVGNLNGQRYEFKFYDKPGNVKNYIPALITGGRTDDDTDFEWVYVYQMQKSRTVLIPYKNISAFWAASINREIWCANRYARYLMDLGITPPLTGNVVLNPWSEFNVSGQFLCETYGLLAPAMPQTAAKIGLHYTKVAIDGEPAQTTQLFTTMISTAFVEKDINKILDAGVTALDPKSIFVQIISDVRAWHKQYPLEWEKVHQLIHQKYKKDDSLTRNRNGSELNTASIIAAFLYGEGDFAETVRYGINFGYDADCNTATLGTIMGVMYGYRGMMSEGWTIVDRYKNNTRDNMPMDETITSFADRVIELFELVNEENGGSKTVINNQVVYNIRTQKPASIIALASVEAQKEKMRNEMDAEITGWLTGGDRQARARAAYLAVCLDKDTQLAKEYPQQWKEACHALSGYWKVIHNIFSDVEFRSRLALKAKFEKAGFVALAHPVDSTKLFNDMEAWKDPKELYSAKK